MTHALLWTRGYYEYNNDPQRRCYDGCHFSTAFAWTPWEILERPATPEIAARKLKFWTELNDYAVSQRGIGAKREFKLTPHDEVTT